MVLAKPKMRGLLEANIKRNLIGMTLTSIAGGLAFKIFYVDKQKQLYADFYKYLLPEALNYELSSFKIVVNFVILFFRTYDAEASLKKMNESGFMQSCPK